MNTGSRSRTTVAVWVGFAVLTALFHGWWITSPLDHTEQNLGHFLGFSARIWQEFGFFELWGMPYSFMWPRSAELGFQYLNHPPLLFWITYGLGGDEWALRLPGIVAAWLAGVALFGLARDRIGDGLAAAAGATLMLCPGMAVMSMASCETAVVAAGLGLWVAVSRGWRRSAALIALCAPFIDWQFAFYAFALVALRWDGPWRTFRELLVPGVCALLGAAGVFGWRAWVLTAPFATPRSVWDIMSTATGARPSFGAWLVAAQQLVVDVAGWPLVVVAVVGLPLLAGRAPRAAVALVVAGLSPLVVFARHALDHGIFYTLMTPLVVAAGIAAWAAVGRGSPRIALAGAWLVCAATCATSLERVLSNRTGLQREVGAQLVERAREDGGGWIVLTDYPHVLPYYVNDARVLPHRVEAPQGVETIRGSSDATRGVVFLRWLAGPGTPLGDYLDQFESWPAQFEEPVRAAPPYPGGPRWVRIPRP